MKNKKKGETRQRKEPELARRFRAPDADKGHIVLIGDELVYGSVGKLCKRVRHDKTKPDLLLKGVSSLSDNTRRGEIFF